MGAVGHGCLLARPRGAEEIAVVLYLAFWVINRWRSKKWGGPWSGWDFTALALIVGAYASAAFGAFWPGKGLGAANDVLIYGLVFLAVRRSRFEEKFLWRLFAVAIMATLLTLLYGYWGLLVTKEKMFLELNSVGHVNHGAIYMAIIFSMALAWAGVAIGSWRQRALLWVAVAMLWGSLFVSQARGALIPVVIFVLLWIFAWAKLKHRAQLKPVLLVLLAFGGAILSFPGVVEKTKGNIEARQLGSYRPALAKVALLALREYPAFGVGITNFGKIKPEIAARWQEQSGQLFSPEELVTFPHAHSLYFNTLAERGVVGTLPLLVFPLHLDLPCYAIVTGRGDAVTAGALGSSLGCMGDHHHWGSFQHDPASRTCVDCDGRVWHLASPNPNSACSVRLVKAPVVNQ